ncbi:MAG: lamin tail domain-containing protein [Verrucomicrobiales bacterium]|nr:lamin tail domain-containing protein [Verrucomicrobiales bacterium]
MPDSKRFRWWWLAGWLVWVSAAGQAQTVGLLREVWEGIEGGSVSDLTSSPNYPDHPTSSNYVTDFFEAPTDVLESYGQRMHGYVVAPLTGDYTFWIASDDGGSLLLSTDENPANAREVASVRSWTPPRVWENEANQRSAAIRLTAGKAYYISALMKEGGGGDNLAVRWLMPNGVDQAPIVGTNLLPFGISFTSPVISRQPSSTSAVEGDVARFSVELSTVGPANYQWKRNGSVVPGGDGAELVYGPVRFTDQGARFAVTVTNRLGRVTSDEAVLTVTPDQTPPRIAEILNIGTTTLRITFSESVSATDAVVTANYALSPSLTVREARVGASPSIVELTVDAMTFGRRYQLTVSGIRDQAQTPNTILPNSAIEFTANEYAPGLVGQPPVPGRVDPATGGADVSGAGEIGGRADRFLFAYQLVSGDFDRRVKVVSFTPTDPFALAGLMARASLETNSVFAASVTTPAQVGSFFLSRFTTGADAARAGSFPANHPETWLRLARVGASFRSYASFDGVSWIELGRANINMPSTVFLGFAGSSRDDARAAVVQFREAADSTGAAVVTSLPRREETLGPSSRHTPLAITEIMYHPRERADGRNTEFIEVYNGDLVDQDLTGHRISGSVAFSFPAGYVLPAGGFAVIARSPGDLSAVYGLTGVLGPFEGTNNLPNAGGIVRLRNPRDAVLLEVEYDSASPWPVAADGAGHSLVLARPSYGEGDARAWAASDLVGGSPARPEAVRVNPLRSIVINEILAHTDLPQIDFVELYNHSNEAVDLSGCVITDDVTTNRFRIPNGTTITPRGFLAFDENQLGFRLNAAGETVTIFNPTLTRVVDAVRVGAQENGVSTGRYPDGTPEWRRLKTVTQGNENTAFRVSDIVINEIMFAPISQNDDDEYVELYNRTAASVDLTDWTLSDGVDFRFPAGTTIQAGGYVVVTRDRTRFLTNYPAVQPGIVFGNFSGSLANSGERIALAKPDDILSTNELGLVVTDRIHIEVDEVTYATGGQWGRWSDGLGSSLELIDAESDHLRPSNWADSDETAKSTWTTIEFTGRVDNVASGVSSDRLHLVAQGPGEYLIDDIQVLAADGSSRLANGDFSSGTTGWTAQGNHRGSVLDETGGVGGSRALRVAALGRGDTSVNRVRANLSPALTANANATLRAKVRWLRGWPEFLLRTRGSGIEAYGRLALPTNLGTPGARNSRAVDNAGPAIVDVRHSPPVPRDREAVVVTARVTDPDTVLSVNLRYRVDPNTSLSTTAMRDDGTGGDAVAGDGVYSATVTGRTAGTLIAFRIEAGDGATTQATSVFPALAPAREALIRWGEEKPFGNLGVYRFWQRKSDYDRLRNREPLANDNVDCTFVYGDERVIYNAEMRGKGSPWHGGSVGADYIFSMPDDNRLLGARDMAVVTLGNLGSDPSAQREQAAFWIGRELGVPALHRRHVQFFENGGSKGLYEDTEEPNGLFADRWFPDGQDGDLFKIEDWFEFDDAGSSFVFSRDATLERFLSVGQLKLARYRWAWRKRAVVESANDYAGFFSLVDVVNGTGANYVSQVEGQVDVDAWMRAFALQHVVGNWDAYGYNRGKNSYLYLPRDSRWKIIPWDIDFVLGSGGDGPTADVFGSVDPVISKLWNTPAFLRMYWRAFQDAVNGPLLAEKIGPLLEGRYAALVANGFNVEQTGAIKNFVSQRRQYLQDRLKGIDAARLEITSNGGANFTTNRNLATLAGSAPIAAATLQINGVDFPVAWTGVTTWSVAVPLAAATNVLRFTALDRLGQPLPDYTDTITVRYTGQLPQPAGLVAINEIQFDPPTAGAAFVEIHNASATGSFDLTGWRLDGVDFTFPSGSVLAPGGFLVVAADLAAFRLVYGTTVIPIGAFGGNLQNNGETLRLIQPGLAPGGDKIIDEVRYASQPPWPTQTRGLGPSLQLIDPLLDHRRVANWAAANVEDATKFTPGRANTTRASLEPFPTLWLNEVLPVNQSGATDRVGDRDPWVELYNSGTETLDLTGLYLSSSSSNLTAWAFPSGTVIGAKQFLVVWCDGEPGESVAGELHTDFRLSADRGSVVLARMQSGKAVALDFLDYANLAADKAWGSLPDGDPLRRQFFHQPTPGRANTAAAPPLLVFINEWMASNGGIVLDPADRDPDDWFELYNAGSTPADLSDYTLTDVLAEAAKFRIPRGTLVPPGGYLLVWADEETGQTTNGQLHVNFKLSGSGEALGLFAPDGTTVDALSFGAQSDNVSQGRFPDAGEEPFVFMDVPTPGAANSAATANQPPVLAISGARSVDEGTALDLQASATDPDAGQQLQFSLFGAPAGTTIDAASGRIRWLTTEADGPGEYMFTVRVTDNGTPPRSDTETVTVSVRELNQPPILDSVSPQKVNEGDTLTLRLVARDPDLPAQSLTFSLPGTPPSGVQIHPTTGELTWTPAEAQGPGTYAIGVLVTDSGADSKSSLLPVEVQVMEVNNAPVFQPVGLQTAQEGAPFTLTLVAVDPDSPPKSIRYRLETAPSRATLDPVTGVFAWQPQEEDGPGSYQVIAHAEEEGGAPSSTLTFSIVVSEKNEPPTIQAIPNFDVSEGDTVAFNVVASDADYPVQKLTYSLASGAPAGATIDPNSGAFAWPIDPDLGAATNVITVQVIDDALGAVPSTQRFTVIVRPVAKLVLHEIMYAPTAGGTAFVEIRNLSATTAWALDGWQLTGLAHDFAPGTRLGPTNYLVVAQDPARFRALYGTNAVVVGPASPSFGATDPMVVQLRRPSGGEWIIVDEVAFDRTAPWPVAANGGGASLQLIDANQDNRRVANWAALAGATTNAPRNLVAMDSAWKYFQTGAAPAGWFAPTFNDTAWPSGKGLLYVEDAALPGPKNTALTRTDGRMTYCFRTAFNFDGDPAGASLQVQTIVDDAVVLYLNGKEIYRLGIAGTTAINDATPAERTVSDAVLEGPFTVAVSNLVKGPNVLAAEVHQINATSSDIVWGANIDVLEVRREPATPGYANSVQGTLPPFPEVWISEVLPRNTNGAVDNAGDRDPWIELWNSGEPSVNLTGWWLTDDLSRLTKWAFPADAAVPGQGYHLVWLDNESSEATATAWHASFVASYPAGLVALVRNQNGTPTVVDYVRYAVSNPDQSFGTLEPDSPSVHGTLPGPTPGGANQGNRPPRLEPIANQTVAAGNLLAFAVIATDPDIGQTLRYALEAPVPSGAAIDAVTGRFTWTPSGSDAGTRRFAVVVTDNAVVPLGDRREFNVNVTPPVTAQVHITGFEWMGDGQIRLTWETTVGRTYRVETAGSVEGSWRAVGEDQVATGSELARVLPATGVSGFYRVLQLP